MSQKLDKAKQKVDEAETEVTAWNNRVDSLQAQLEEAESNIGQEAFESGDVKGAAERLRDLRSELEVAREGARAAVSAQEVAEREALRVEAGDLKAEASKVDKEADKHEAKTKELLSALEEHEGGPYEPLQPPLGGGIASDIELWVPQSERLRNEAEFKRRRAVELEEQADR